MRPKSSLPIGFTTTFQEQGARFVERARFLLWTALVLYPAFWLLDLMIIPEEAFSFLTIRICVASVYLWGLTAVYSRLAERLARPFLLASAVGSAAGLFLMAAYLDRSFNGYFADSIVILVVIGLFVSWDVGAAAALAGLVLLIAVGIHLAVHGPSVEMARLISILAGSGGLIVLAAFSRRWTQRTQRMQRWPAGRGHSEDRDSAYAGLPPPVLETVSAGRSLEGLPPPAAHDSTASP